MYLRGTNGAEFQKPKDTRRTKDVPTLPKKFDFEGRAGSRPFHLNQPGARWRSRRRRYRRRSRSLRPREMQRCVGSPLSTKGQPPAATRTSATIWRPPAPTPPTHHRPNMLLPPRRRGRRGLQMAPLPRRRLCRHLQPIRRIPSSTLSSDADKSDATPVPDNEGGQTSTSVAPKDGASTSDPDQDDDKKAEAAKKPKYTLGQAIEKVRRFII